MTLAKRLKKEKRTVYIVVWSELFVVEEDYKYKPIFDVEPAEQFKVPCNKKCHTQKWHWGSSLAVFETKGEAEAWAKSYYPLDLDKYYTIKEATLEFSGGDLG